MLKSILCLSGLEALRLSYTQLFPLACTPGTEAEQDFFNLLNNVSSWGEVRVGLFHKELINDKLVEFKIETPGRERAGAGVLGAALLSGHA